MTLPKLADVDPALLTTIGDSAIGNINNHLAWHRDPATPPSNTRRRTRWHTCGVTARKGRWLGQWGPHGKSKVTRGRFATDRDAAVARAAALGLDFLEKRDGTREGI